ncbi:hypothetical protein D3C85_1302500 [compost metagenome]
MDVQRNGAQRRITRLLEENRLLHMAQPQPAHFLRGMGRQQAMGAGLFHQFLAQLGGGAVGGLPRVAFQGDDLIGDEAPDFGLQGEQVGREREMHGCVPCVLK